jgi:hypothetical protein
MWPWEHLAVGYILLSIYCHGRAGTPPTEWSVLTLAVATQLPDVIDKPLAWQFGILTGTSIAHSILVSLLLIFIVGIVSGRIGRPAVSTAFAVGYLSHLLADLAYPMIRGRGHFAWGAILWPGPERVVTEPSTAAAGSGASTVQTGAGFLSQVGHRFGDFVSFLGTPSGQAYLLLELILLGSAITLWVLDGKPGIHVIADYLHLGRLGSYLE